MISQRQEIIILRALLGPKKQRNYERAVKLVERQFVMPPKHCRSRADYRAYRRVMQMLIDSKNFNELLEKES